MMKYKEYFNQMVKENKEIFGAFTKIHFEYSTDQERYQEEFNREGEKILKIIHEWENRLCKLSESAGYGTFTGNLAEKFQTETKNHFPLIDHVGVIPKPKMLIKRIRL